MSPSIRLKTDRLGRVHRFPNQSGSTSNRELALHKTLAKVLLTWWDIHEKCLRLDKDDLT